MIIKTLQRLEPYTEMPAPPNTLSNEVAKAAWFRDGTYLVERRLLDPLTIGPFGILCQVEAHVKGELARDVADAWMKRHTPAAENEGAREDADLLTVYRDLRADFGLPI